LDCFANNGKSQEALDLFETMKKHENKALRPDIVSYNSLLNALARAENPIEEVEKVLHEMEDVMSPVEPDKVSYTCKCAFGIACCCSWLHPPATELPFHILCLHRRSRCVGRIVASRQANEMQTTCRYHDLPICETKEGAEQTRCVRLYHLDQGLSQHGRSPVTQGGHRSLGTARNTL
jgi:pentatricopeptide repeat protein